VNVNDSSSCLLLLGYCEQSTGEVGEEYDDDVKIRNFLGLVRLMGSSLSCPTIYTRVGSNPEFCYAERDAQLRKLIHSDI